ncbi:pyridoxamine 5'-phosphate oxidase family protein [Streptacidiphilus rugosus]|uniref:pyridoxamine 5'-phosphate oxidase family protein n=1 Tax=Streptacidiphilus rugosus TaxID=405783 RepID=UPI0009FFBB8C|nr:pyridoxamine 5'-phosphate oxidase family protein [Streptacidiphilus rugosus]
MLQQRHGTAERAAAFYDRQVHPSLTSAMRAFIARMPMVFLSTADAGGECDASFRAGPPGFVQVLDDRTLAYPEYRGNGVMASSGNIAENPHLGMLFMDFTHDHVGLHVNGTAALYPDARLRSRHPDLPVDPAPGRRPELWVHVRVDEAYIHCSKHIPHLEPAARPRDPESTRPRDQHYFTAPQLPRQPDGYPPVAAELAEEHEKAPQGGRARWRGLSRHR